MGSMFFSNDKKKVSVHLANSGINIHVGQRIGFAGMNERIPCIVHNLELTIKGQHQSMDLLMQNYCIRVPFHGFMSSPVSLTIETTKLGNLLVEFGKVGFQLGAGQNLEQV
jgi:hypothetical protein